LAADLGLSVALVDPEVNPGGVCVYRGCIPSKALLHVANLVTESRHAKAWGIEFGEPAIDLAKLRRLQEQRRQTAHERDRPAGQAPQGALHPGLGRRSSTPTISPSS